MLLFAISLSFLMPDLILLPSTVVFRFQSFLRAFPLSHLAVIVVRWLKWIKSRLDGVFVVAPGTAQKNYFSVMSDESKQKTFAISISTLNN